MTTIIPKGWGQIVNHYSTSLLVIENDSGPPIAHILPPKHKTRDKLDADGFKRLDGQSILRHDHWWKIWDYCTAHIYQLGDDILLPLSLMRAVSDKEFGAYTVEHTEGWGVKLTYITEVIRDKNHKTIGYIAENYGQLSKAKAIELAHEGILDNVCVVHQKNGNSFLRSRKNGGKNDNLSNF